MPTGGITAASAPAYLAHPSVVAVGGSWMVAPDLLAAGQWDEVAARCAAAVRLHHPRPARSLRMIQTRPAAECEFDIVALGEVMLRLDPGEGRVRTARRFEAWEGGGEYNVARGMRKVFGLRAGVVTALADNEIGRLVENLILQGGVDTSLIHWETYDGIGRTVRNGLNFTERGFGVRGAVGVSDRANTAISKLAPGDVDWDDLFGRRGVRWLHTGGIYAALSESSAAVAEEAMAAAQRHGTVVSFDLNYRPSLWAGIGGTEFAKDVNTRLAGHVDVMIGNEEDFTAALGFERRRTSTRSCASCRSTASPPWSARSPRRCRGCRSWRRRCARCTPPATTTGRRSPGRRRAAS